MVVWKDRGGKREGKGAGEIERRIWVPASASISQKLVDFILFPTQEAKALPASAAASKLQVCLDMEGCSKEVSKCAQCRPCSALDGFHPTAAARSRQGFGMESFVIDRSLLDDSGESVDILSSSTFYCMVWHSESLLHLLWLCWLGTGGLCKLIRRNLRLLEGSASHRDCDRGVWILWPWNLHLGCQIRTYCHSWVLWSPLTSQPSPFHPQVSFSPKELVSNLKVLPGSNGHTYGGTYMPHGP